MNPACKEIYDTLPSHNIETYSMEDRQRAAWQVAEIVNKYSAKLPLPNVCVEELHLTSKQKGPTLFTSAETDEIKAYLADKRVYDKNMPKSSHTPPRPLDCNFRAPYASYDLQTVVNAPHILKAALHNDVLAAAQSFLGCRPTLYAIQLWWSFGGYDPQSVQNWHRDFDDFNFCTLVCYLTDVNEANGPFVIQPASHICHPGDGYPEFVFCGKAGESLWANTYAMHKGTVPTGEPRLALWFRYGLYQHRIYGVDTQGLVASPFTIAEEKAEVARLICHR